MKTDKVIIKDFKVIKDLNQEINGNHVLLLGDNGVGKSSFIQFIRIALGDQSSIPPNAVGEGEVTFTKDGKPYVFSVKLKDGKPNVTVTGPDGMKDNRKGTIASIVGALDFNVDEFVELSKTTAGKKKQVEIFKSFLPDDIKEELLKYEVNVKVSFDERTELNKSIKQKEGFVKEHRLFNIIGVKKFKKTDLKEAIENLQKLKEHNSLVKTKSETFEENSKKLDELQTKINEMMASHKRGLAANEEISKWLKDNEAHKLEVIEAAEIEINDVEKNNKDFDDSEMLKKEIDLLEKMKEEAGELTAKIESSREAIANTIRDMDSPVDGLTYDDEMLVYNGVPVSSDTLSTSEIMELGIRLKMAENPDLGILFIERGESLGAERLNLIHEIANKSGWQIIMEQVERGNKSLKIELTTE